VYVRDMFEWPSYLCFLVPCQKLSVLGPVDGWDLVGANILHGRHSLRRFYIQV